MNSLGIYCKETEHLSEVLKQTPCCPDFITMGILVTTVFLFLFSVMFGVMLGAFCFNKLYAKIKYYERKRIEAEYVDKPEQTISNEPDYKYYEK